MDTNINTNYYETKPEICFGYSKKHTARKLVMVIDFFLFYHSSQHPSDPGLGVLSEEMLLMTAFDDHSFLLPYTQLHSHRVSSKVEDRC